MHHPLLARVYDAALWPAERMGMRARRDRLVGRVGGRVIEIAVGTGLNLPHYPATAVVDAVEIDRHMLAGARRRAAGAICTVRLQVADATRLPFDDDVFDAVVIGLGLCTISPPEQALAEARRVSKPGAPLHFLEHVRSPSPIRSRWQDLVAPAWSRVAGGCRLNQDTVALVEEAGYRIESIHATSRGTLVQGVAHPR